MNNTRAAAHKHYEVDVEFAATFVAANKVKSIGKLLNTHHQVTGSAYCTMKSEGRWCNTNGKSSPALVANLVDFEERWRMMVEEGVAMVEEGVPLTPPPAVAVAVAVAAEEEESDESEIDKEDDCYILLI